MARGSEYAEHALERERRLFGLLDPGGLLDHAHARKLRRATARGRLRLLRSSASSHMATIDAVPRNFVTPSHGGATVVEDEPAPRLRRRRRTR